METFRKRQKEMKRLERRQDKAAKRKEIKERKAAGLPEPQEDSTEASDDAVQPDSGPDSPDAASGGGSAG